MGYWVYIVRCADNSLYCGSTACLERRIEEHNAGKGAKYTLGRRPIFLVQAWQVENRSQGQKLEELIKKCSKQEKLGFVNGPDLLLAKAQRQSLDFLIKAETQGGEKNANRPN